MLNCRHISLSRDSVPTLLNQVKLIGFSVDELQSYHVYKIVSWPGIYKEFHTGVKNHVANSQLHGYGLRLSSEKRTNLYLLESGQTLLKLMLQIQPPLNHSFVRLIRFYSFCFISSRFGFP